MNDQTPRKVAIICSKGTLDMAYPGPIEEAEGAQVVFVQAIASTTQADANGHVQVSVYR